MEQMKQIRKYLVIYFIKFLDIRIIIAFVKKNIDFIINENNEVIFEDWCELERLIKDNKEGANL